MVKANKGFTQSSYDQQQKVVIASVGEGFLMGDWAELPYDLLSLIAKQTHLYEDFIAIGGVCRSWRSVAVKENFNHCPQIPWLMLPEGEEKGGENNLRGFASLTKGGMVHRVELPPGWRSCFSSMGWLITTNAADDMELLHPLTRVSIPLPHPRTIKYYASSSYSYTKLLDRAVLSASPSLTEDYVLMVTFGGFYVGYWKPGNNIWTAIETRQHSDWIHDVVYYKDQFYAINYQGHLLLCDMNSCTSQIVGRIRDGVAGKTPIYLVECGGELLLVSRRNHGCFDGFVYRDIWFEVFKFDSTDFNNLHLVDDFGGRSIFVGDGAAASAVMACAAGTESNCIYYSEDFLNQYVRLYRKEYYGTGVYHWGAEIRKLATEGMAFRTSIWVSPSF